MIAPTDMQLAVGAVFIPYALVFLEEPHAQFPI